MLCYFGCCVCLCYLLTCESVCWQLNWWSVCGDVRCMSAERQPNVTWYASSHHFAESWRGSLWYGIAPGRWPAAVDDRWSAIVFLCQPPQSYDTTCICCLLCFANCPGFIYLFLSCLNGPRKQSCVQTRSWWTDWSKPTLTLNSFKCCRWRRLFTCESSYCFQCVFVLAIAILSLCLSIRPSVWHMGGSVKNGAS